MHNFSDPSRAVSDNFEADSNLFQLCSILLDFMSPLMIVQIIRVWITLSPSIDILLLIIPVRVLELSRTCLPINDKYCRPMMDNSGEYLLSFTSSKSYLHLRRQKKLRAP